MRPKKKDYKVTCRILDAGKGRPLYGLCFNLMDERYKDVFATCGVNRVVVYRCHENGTFDFLQAYVDENKEENFYTVCWTVGTGGVPLLIASGYLGVIRIIDCFHEKPLRTLVGHGGSVNELRAHPLQPNLLLSASKDESVRLWNVMTGVCILQLAGANGHRNEVLSADFHPLDKTKVASCGMDASIRIWSLKEFWHIVELSETWAEHPSKFPTKNVQYPIFTTVGDVHTNYVDHLRWLGNLILTKSVDNEILLWKPMTHQSSDQSDGSADVLQRYPVPECDIWFLKFSLDFHSTVIAVGNRDGKLFVFETFSCPPVEIARLSHGQCRTAVRQTAVSFDARIILCCCEDGSIWRWDAAHQGTPPPETPKSSSP